MESGRFAVLIQTALLGRSGWSRRLSVKHERRRDRPWSTDDVPRDFIEAKLTRHA